MNCKIIMKSLIVAIFTMLGSVSYGQYVPADEAITILQLEIERVQALPDVPPTSNGVQAPNPVVDKKMKVYIMEHMVEMIQEVKEVAPVFQTIETHLSQGPAERRVLVTPYLSELKNLLS